MNTAVIQNETWLRALSLGERVMSAPGIQPVDHTENYTGRDEARLRRWQSESPFDRAGLFAKKLAAHGITEQELSWILSESPADLQQRIALKPEWLETIIAAYTASAVNDSIALTPQSDGDVSTFLMLVDPLIAQGRDRLRSGFRALAQEFPAAPYAADELEMMFVKMLIASLPERLDRTLVLELNVARLQNLLEGETAADRYDSFVRRLRDPEIALAILQEYPVLARQAVIAINHWVEFALEFAGRLCEDFATIRLTLNGDCDPGRLVELSGGVGDGHARGRSVLIVDFESGFRTVYKPKSVAVVQHFQELLGWLNSRGAEPPLKTIAVVERGTHGWIEFVEHSGCTTAEQIRRFYLRQGEYLALFYALEATDFHAENVIACGEHPVPIDLEAVFHPRTTTSGSSGVERAVAERLHESVLRVGLLPDFAWGRDGEQGVDVSGFGNLAGKMTPYGVPDWDQSGTDEMRLVRRPVPMSGSHNRPTLEGNDIEVLDYLNEVLSGFTSMYRLLEKHCGELPAANGPLARFQNDEVRAVLRPTRIYGLLLQESFHPDLLRDALDRDRLFDRLYGRLEFEPCLERILSAELEELNLGDIPIFSTRPASRDVWDSRGRRVAGFYSESGAELVARRLHGLNDDDLHRQRWYIQAAFASLAGSQGYGAPTVKHVEVSKRADSQRYLAAACRVGDHLVQQAVRCGSESTWVGLLHVRDTQWSTGALGLDLYNGLPGVALFLGHLGAATGEARYTSLARAATETMLRQLSIRPMQLIGAFEGLGGIIHTLTHLSCLWGDLSLQRQAELVVRQLLPLVDQDSQLDVIGGAAGCLGTLLANHKTTGSPAALAAAVHCGEHLLAKATRCEAGIGWLVPKMSTRPLSGFSHGVSGASWSLMELSARTRDDRFRNAALAAVHYERSLFSNDVGNWRDVRDFADDKKQATSIQRRHVVAWCHGAPGIGLSRLLGLAHFESSAVHREIDVALRSTLAEGFGGTPTLCHGDLGNIDLLLEAARILNNPHWRRAAELRGERVLAQIETEGWTCATPLGVTSPGLMTGLAGIGYGLLRLADPLRTPSVLSLAPPIAR